MLALVPGPAWAQTIRDVPTDHWAYAAVQRLINEGYLTLEDNQMFRGDRPVDRYTFAVAVARVLDQVEETGGTLPRETQQLLTRLATEFQEELVAWHAASSSWSSVARRVRSSWVSRGRVPPVSSTWSSTRATATAKVYRSTGRSPRNIWLSSKVR